MKIISRLAIFLITVLAASYGGAWYLTCMEIEKSLGKDALNFQFDLPEKGSVAVSTAVASVQYAGYDKGEALIAYQVNGLTSKANVTVGPSRGESTATVSFPDTPVTYYIGGPIYGDTVSIRMGDIKRMVIEQTVNNVKLPSTTIAGSPGGVAITFAHSDFFYNRVHTIKQYVSNPKRLIREAKSVTILPADVTMTDSTSGKPIAHSVFGKNAIQWQIQPDGIFALDIKADLNAEYHEGFGEYMQNISQAQMATLSQAPVPTELLSVFNRIMLSGRVMKIKGGLRFRLPADKIGLSDESSSLDTFPVPPFEIAVENLEYKMPFPLSSTHVINAGIAFDRGEGKPIKITYNEESPAETSGITIDDIIKMLGETPEIKQSGVDFSKLTIESIKSVRDLEATQGAVVMVVSALKAWEKLYKNNTTKSILSAEITTPSGKADPLGLLTAKGAVSFSTHVGSDIALNISGDAQGAVSWKGTVSVKNLDKFLLAFKDSLKIFGSRTLVAMFFTPQDLDAPPVPGEEKIIETVLSDDMFNEALSALNKISRLVDQTPDSKDEITINLTGQAKNVLINGKDPEQYALELAPQVETVANEFMSKIQALIPTQEGNTPSMVTTPSRTTLAEPFAEVKQEPTAEVTVEVKEVNGVKVGALTFAGDKSVKEIFYKLGPQGERQSTGEGMIKDPVSGLFPAQQVIRFPSHLNPTAPVHLFIDWVELDGTKHAPVEVVVNLH